MSTQPLADRVNLVINTEAFEAALRKYRMDLIDFQFMCSTTRSFHALPPSYQEVLLIAENALAANKAE